VHNSVGFDEIGKPPYTGNNTGLPAVVHIMKTYTFKVVVEPDEDRWHAYCPALEGKGASTWGHTREEALKRIDEVVQLVVDSMIEHGEFLPNDSTDDVQVTVEPRVTITV
jgi:predicted RNase H-like HicB family nuclease